MRTTSSINVRHDLSTEEATLDDFEMTDKNEEKETEIEGTEPTPLEPHAPERDIEKANSLTERDESEAQPQINVNDWNGPDDQDNPHNWPTWLRVYHAVVPGLFGFAVSVSAPFSSSVNG